jgi:predicted ester cyclase
MSIEENKAIVIRHLKEVLEQGRVELIESYLTPDGSPTPERVKGAVLWHHKYAPGYKVTILDIVAEGDQVMANIQYDVTYSVPPESPPGEFDGPPLGKPVSWRNMNVWRIVDGKMVSEDPVSGWTDMLVALGVIPLEKIVHNKAAVRKFVDAVNNRDTALLAEVCTPEMAKGWTEWLPGMYASMKDHHIEINDLVADGEMVGMRMATSGLHTGDIFGLPPTGKPWTNRVYTFFRFVDGKISEVDALPDAENHIKQLGGAIQPVAA